MQNTIDILSSINITVKEIAKSMAPQNGSSEAAISKLSKGNVTTNADVNPAVNVEKPNISKANIGDIVSVLNTLSPSVLSIAKISKSQINRFIKVLDAIIKSVNKLSECAKSNKNSANNVKIIVESFDILTSSIGKGAKLIVTAPLATLGLKLANGTIKAMGDILKTVSKISNVNDKIKKLNNITKAIDPLVTFVMKAAILTGICMGLGLLLMLGPTKDMIIGGLLVLGAVMLTVSAIILLTGFAGKMIKVVGAFGALKDIMALTLASVILVAACFGLGMAIEAMGGWIPLMKGLATVGATLVMLTAVFWLIGLAGKIATSPDLMKSYAGIFVLTLASFALIVGAKYLGDFAAENYDSILGGLGCVFGTMAALIGIGRFANRWLLKSKNAVISLGIVELVALGAMAVIVASKYLYEYTNGHEVEILAGIGLTIAIVVAFGALAALAGKLKKYIVPGTIALGYIELLAAGAIALAGLVVGLDYITKKNNITWGDLYLDVAGIAGIVVVFGVIAGAASFIAPAISAGLTALFQVELLVAGAIGITYLLIKLHNVKSKAGIEWDDLAADIDGISNVISTFGLLALGFGVISPLVILGSAALVPVELLMLGAIGITHLLVNLHSTITKAKTSFDELKSDVFDMSLIMGTFGVLAAAMSLLIVPIALGTPGMLAVSGFALLVVGVVHKIIGVSNAIEKAGGAEKIKQTLSVGIPAILKNINAENLSVDLGAVTMLKMIAKYALLSKLVGSILSVAESISKISQIAGIIDDSGKIRQILYINKETGEVKYGEPVDIKNIATVISQAVKAFVENSQYSFRDVVRMYNAKGVFNILSTITTPVSKFVEMLTGFTAGNDPNTLATVKVNEKGEVKIGEPVNVVEVAKIISGAISSFVSELYKKENTEHWAELIYGDRTVFEEMFGKTNKRAKSVKEVVGILGTIIDPICKFVDMVSGLTPGSDGKLRKIYIDKDGNIKTGPDIDVKKTGLIISDLITSFITSVYNTSNEWKGISTIDGSKLDTLLKPINSMIASAEELSGEKIKSALIKSNADAIVYFNGKFVNSISSIDIETVNTKAAVVQSLLNIANGMSNISGEKILSNSSSIVSFMTNVVEKKMPKVKPTVDVFTKSIERLRKSFKDLDTILIKDDYKRNKALDEFEKRIKEIINTINGGKEAMDSYNKVLSNTQDYSTPSNQQQPAPYAPSPYLPSNQHNTVNQNISNGNTVMFDPEELTTAFVSALKNLKITPDETADTGKPAVRIVSQFKIT